MLRVQMNSRRQPITLPTISYMEVKALAESICMLPIDRLTTVVDFVCRAGGFVSINEVELVIDFESLQPAKLRTLQSYMQSWKCSGGSNMPTPPSTPATPPPQTSPQCQQGNTKALSLLLQSLTNGDFANLVETMCKKEEIIIYEGQRNMLGNFEALQPDALRVLRAYVHAVNEQVSRDRVDAWLKGRRS